jgi:primosomal protein N' (replication factor Y)
VSRPEPTPLWDTPEPLHAENRAKAKPAKAKSAAAEHRGQQRPAAVNPVARVIVDIPLTHLDRTFDYHVPEKLDEAAVPGCRVRVRYAG